MRRKVELVPQNSRFSLNRSSRRQRVEPKPAGCCGWEPALAEILGHEDVRLVVVERWRRNRRTAASLNFDASMVATQRGPASAQVAQLRPVLPPFFVTTAPRRRCRPEHIGFFGDSDRAVALPSLRSVISAR